MTDIAALGISVDSKQAAAASGDLDKLSRAARGAETSTERLARQTNAASASWQRYAVLAARAAQVTAALGAAAVGALALMARRTLTAVDEQAKLADRLGASIDGLRGLQIAAADAGVDTGVLNSSMDMLNRRLGEAATGGGPAAEALARLGLNARELAALDADQRLAAIADQMKAAGLSGSEAAFALRELGIRSGEMVNLMRGGGDAIRAARREVEEYGLSLSRTDASAIERANDAMSRTGRVVEVVATRLTVALAPGLEAIANWLNELTRLNGGWRAASEQASLAIVDSVVDVIDTYERANLAAARFLLFFLEAQEASARFGAGVREAFGGAATDYQREIIAAAEAQRAFVAELEAADSYADSLRRHLAEARAAGPLELTIGGGLSGGISTPELVAPYQEAAAQIAAIEDAAEATKRERAARDLEMLRAGLRTAEEAELVSQQQRLATLASVFEARLVSEQEYLGLRELLQLDHAERLAMIRAEELEAHRREAEERARIEQGVQSQITAMRVAAANTAVGLLTTLGGKSRAAALAAIALNKSLMIAQAIQSGAAAEIRALAELGPIAGPPVAAQFRAWTAANVALIAATGLAQAAGGGASGGGGGGGAGGGAAVAAAPAPARSRDVTVVFGSDRRLFDREEIGALLEGLNDYLDDGARIRVA